MKKLTSLTLCCALLLPGLALGGGPKAQATDEEGGQHILREGPVKVYKEPSERAATRVIFARKSDLVWVFETKNGWTLIHVGKYSSDQLWDPGFLPGGWVPNETLGKLIHVDQ